MTENEIERSIERGEKEIEFIECDPYYSNEEKAEMILDIEQDLRELSYELNRRESYREFDW